MAERHHNLVLLDRGMAAFAAHDLAVLGELFSEELLWHHGGKSVLAGTYRGIDEVFELFARRAAMTGDTYSVSIESAVANDSFVTVLARVSARCGDKTLSDGQCSVYRIASGKVVEAWHMFATPEAEADLYR
jgi:ketosteroid isomerase-like protein